MTDEQAAAQARAEKSIRALYALDIAAQEFGIRIEALGPGYARLSMPVRDDMLNGHKVCHGGHIFGLADTAFAYACNSYDDATLATHCAIDFIRPGRPGTVLTATARERSRGRRLGVYDVEVTDTDNTLVALFRGESYATGRPITGRPSQHRKRHRDGQSDT
jgi:acyl-CoA thioesterase